MYLATAIQSEDLGSMILIGLSFDSSFRKKCDGASSARSMIFLSKIVVQEIISDGRVVCTMESYLAGLYFIAFSSCISFLAKAVHIGL